MTMPFRPTILATACAAMLLSSCGKPTPDERKELRAKKHENAIKYYKVLANDFVGHKNSDEAARRAAALEAEGKK